MRDRPQSAWDSLLVLYAVALAWRPLDEADTFFHLTLGRAVLNAGARVVPEPTAFVDFTDPAIASEWLWSVLSYAAYGGGYSALSLLGCALAGLAAYCQLRFIRSAAPPGTNAWLINTVSVLTLCVVQCRVSVRPELALLIGLPLYVQGCRAYASAEAPRRLHLGSALALGSVLWAQLHGSFVLSPVLFVLLVAEPRHLHDRARLRTDGLCLVLLLASQLSSAYGLRISELISSHAAGDAPRYIAEMMRPTWGMLDPLAAPNMFSYCALLALGAAGMLLDRRLALRELSIAALGGALFSTANRFIAEAALLSVPLALSGARALQLHWEPAVSSRLRKILRASSLAVGAALLGLTVKQMQATHGPLGQLGVSTHALPVHAVRALQGLPPGAAVLTDYASSSVVGFLGNGRLRTFVDGRTPLYFDDTDFAVAREMERDATALALGLKRYGVTAAVVRRESQSCALLTKHWQVALIEPLYTTFVSTPQAAPPLQALRPCGASYLTAQSCEGPALQADIERVRAAGAGEFARFLQAQRALECGGDGARALRELRKLEPSALPYRAYFQRALVLALLQNRDYAAAEAYMLRALAEREAGMIALLQRPAAGELPLAAARRILERYVDGARDDTDLGARAALAEICARAGDQECARFNATRAAVRGRATQALDWVAEHHDSTRARTDAKRWQQVLRAPPQ